MASGIIGKKVVAELSDTLVKAYVHQLKSLGRVAPKPKTLGDLEAGFRDGMRAMLLHLQEMGVVRIVTDDQPERDAAGEPHGR